MFECAQFGFGVLDAGDMVDLAKKWRALPERFHCNAGALSGQLYAPYSHMNLTLRGTSTCEDTSCALVQ